jgi:hypothetical protein
MNRMADTPGNAAQQARVILRIDDLGTTALFHLADTILDPQRSPRRTPVRRPCVRDRQPSRV